MTVVRTVSTESRSLFLNVVICCTSLTMWLTYSPLVNSLFPESFAARPLVQYGIFLILTASLLGIVLFFRAVLLVPRQELAIGFATASFVVVLLSSIAVVPYLPQPGLWSGFGPTSTAGATIIALILVTKPRISHSLVTGRGRSFLLLVALPLALIAPRLLLFVQPSHGLINLGDTSYHVIDELLAPIAGATVYSDYSPQYSGLLGLLLLPLKYLNLSGDSLLNLTILTCNLLNLAIPLLVTSISRILYPGVKRVLTFCAFVAIWTLPGSDLGASTQIREFANFGRFVPSLIALLLTLRAVRAARGKHVTRNFFLAGAVLGAALVNSPETGGSLLVAVTLGFFVERLAQRITRKATLFTFFGFLSSTFGYVAISFVRGYPVRIESFVGIRGQALAGSVYSDGLTTLGLGPYLLVLVIPFLLFMSQESAIWGRGENRTVLGNFQNTTIGVWTIILATKPMLAPTYVGVQSLFIPTFIGGVALLSSARDVFAAKKNLTGSFVALPILVLLSWPFGAVFPDSRVHVGDELLRISGAVADSSNWSSASPGRPSDAYARDAVALGFVDALESLNEQLVAPDNKIGYFGIFGNTVEVLLDIDNVLGIPAPESLRFGQSQEELACIPVENKRPNLIIVIANNFPCEGYILDIQRSSDSILVYKRV